jgi:hypothetical protein
MCSQDFLKEEGLINWECDMVLWLRVKIQIKIVIVLPNSNFYTVNSTKISSLLVLGFQGGFVRLVVMSPVYTCSIFIMSCDIFQNLDSW